MGLEIPIYCKQAATAVGTKHLWFDETPWENQAPGLLKQLEILTFWSSYQENFVLPALLLSDSSGSGGWAALALSYGSADFFC